MLRRLAPLAVLAALAATPAAAADAAHPAVVELFQSQGCSSCPPANANLMALADRPDVLALSWQVTYWDNLGWKDTFGSKAWTDRQWAYAHAWKRSQVATPQVVVNGRAEGVGARKGEIEALIARQDRGASGPAVTAWSGKVTIGAAPGQGQVLLVRYDPRIVQVPVRAGENAGKTLPHRNVVKAVVVLGEWTGSARTFSAPPPVDARLMSAVIVQAGPGGPVLAAARL